MITLKEIAQLAGVSRGTVDRVLHNRDGVKPDVALNVRNIAEKYGYNPDRAGKALVTRKNPLKIGVVINAEGNQFFDDIIAGMKQAELEYADFALQVLIRSVKGYSPEQQLAAIDTLSAEGVQFFILTSLNHPKIIDKVNCLVEKSVPVITMNSDIENSRRLAYVGCDYLQSGKTAGELVGLFTGGNAKVVIVTGSEKMLGHNQRIDGFVSVCKQDYPDLHIVDIIENNDDDITSYQLVGNILKTGCDPDVIYFCAAGVNGGLRAIHEFQGKGKQIKVVTCDETPAIREALANGQVQATISQQPYQQGYLAVCTAFNSAVYGIQPTSEIIYTKNEIKLKYNL